ncbi:MAG: hypothetical protein J0I21_15425 [Alphaproteobacteria bacterium]|nr:hypothetical protein [Alphaproteobacteria bacterium]
MTTDLELHHLYDRVRLVRGKGNRRSGGLCVMTFVALLAGERHSDAPATASLVVRAFAVSLNDAMPDAERQRLKVFAPRIVGTADGFDAGRAGMVRRVMQQEVLPRICGDLQAHVPLSSAQHSSRDAPTSHAVKELLRGFTAAAAAEDTPRNQREVALLASRLLSACAEAATTSAARAWYWAQAINLLDRLCDVGVPHLRPGPARADIERLLGAESLAGARAGYVRVALQRLRHALAAVSSVAMAGAATSKPMAISIASAPPSGRDATGSKSVAPLVPEA